MLTTPRFWKGFVATLVLFFLGDMLWHGVFLADFYGVYIAAFPGAVLPQGFAPFLVLLNVMAAAGCTYFVLATPKGKNPLWTGFWTGAFLGLLTAGAVNFVNHSLFPQWDITIVMVDTAFGIVLGGIGGFVVAALAGKK